MKKKVEPDPALCFDGLTKLEDKEKIMTQPK